MSDGCEKAAFECNLYDAENKTFFDPNLPFGPFFNPNVKALKKLALENKTQEEINELWAGFLTNGNERFRTEMDDKSMILACLLDD